MPTVCRHGAKLIALTVSVCMVMAMAMYRYGSKFYEGFRMFYLSCAEAFAANEGNEFMCAYYKFVKRG